MLIALLLFGLIGLTAFVFIVFWGVSKVARDQKKAEANAEQTLDALFDGRPDVTFNGHMRTMKYETVIAGAKKRGYTVAHQSGDASQAFTLMFEKTSPPATTTPQA